MLSYFALSALINAISITVLGIVVYAKNSKELVSKTFAAFCLAVGFWSGFYFFVAFYRNDQGVRSFLVNRP